MLQYLDKIFRYLVD